MARAGIYKSEVLRARDKLLALGQYPSIDAIRRELGDTGSKGTIHRYLKEIEEEEGAKSGGKVSVSEPLLDLVARLAERLQGEAQATITELTYKHAEELTQLRQTLEVERAETAELRVDLESSRAQTAELLDAHKVTTDRLQQEVRDHAVAERRVTDLEDRIQDVEAHRQSLEEKHTHARQALEHFWKASKEQREQERRQHEQQVQYLQSETRALQNSLIQAQHDATAYKEESARLTADLARAKQSLSEAGEALKASKETQVDLATARQQVLRLEADFGRQSTRNAELEAARISDRNEVQQLQFALVAAKTTAETQSQLVEKIQVWMAQKPGAAKPVRPAKDR